MTRVRAQSVRAHTRIIRAPTCRRGRLGGLMKKMVLAALSALLVACQVAAGIFSSEPKWLSAPENVYPSAQYFSAVGSGPDRSAAELSAKFALCQNLGERIVGEQRTSQTLTRSSSEATLEINVTEEAIFNHVVGIAIKDTYSEKKKKVTTYYAVAVLNKAEAASYYASKVSQLDSEISALLAEADAAAGSMKLNRRMSTLPSVTV